MKKRLLLLVGALALGGCLETTAPTPSNPATETFAPELGVNIPDMTKTASGTYYKDLTVGTGTTLNVNTVQSVTVDYAGYLRNGVKFDSDTNTVIPINGVIYGFADGIQGMKVGGERLIVIPSDLGYGANSSAIIPPNATLIFQVHLLSFQ